MKKHKKKNPVLIPFDESDKNVMIFSDEEFACGNETKDISTMNYDELRSLEEELVESIADYDTIIDLQLDQNRSLVGFDKESLRMDRKRRQKSVVELRIVRQRIKMLKNTNEEVAIAI